MVSIIRYNYHIEKEIKQRLKWIELYEKTANAGLVCRRCGISRPTLRKWLKRYMEQGISGLANLSRCPKSSPQANIGQQEEILILKLRKERNLGARRIQSELQRLHNTALSVATIHKILTRNNVKPLVKLRKKAGFKRYQKALPGERIQMDTCKISSNLYQYTAIDDCTRYRVLRLYSRRTAANTLDFLDNVIEEMPFPLQRIQTDRGREFFAVEVQQRMMIHGIKFRPNKPASPHLNGKVERSHKTDKIEFYATVDLKSDDLQILLAEWQHYYNWERPHSAHNGKTPMDRYFELSEQTPFSDEIQEGYHFEKERIQHANYRVDLHLRKLK